MDKKTLIAIIVIIAIVILPTLTPEDIFTTIPLIKTLGWQAYFIICIIIIFVLYSLGVKKL